MRLFLFFLYSLLITCPTYAQDIIIKDIDVLPMTSDTVLKKQSVWIQHGKIKQIGNLKEIIKTDQITFIDGRGKFLMPALADMHVHLPEADKIDTLLLSNIAAGVTHIRIMNSKVSQTDLKKRLTNNKNIISPKIHYSHIIRRDKTYTEAQADSLMQAIKKDNVSFVKLLSLADEKTFDHLTRAATKYNIPIGGHYPVYQADGKTEMISMEKTLTSNFKSIEHLAGYIWLQEDSQLEKAVQLTKEYTMYNCPTLDWDIMAYDLQYPDEYQNRLTNQLLPDKVVKKWETNYTIAIDKAGGTQKVMEAKEKYLPTFNLKLKILKKLYENECLLLIGGDAGNNFQADGFNVYEEMINWSKAGIDNYTILRSATVTSAQFFNESGQWGTIEAGKNAELLILDKNPLENIRNIATIQTTIVGNTIFKNKELIDQL